MKSEVIEVNPNKVSGTPVFAGTRVPIKNLFDYLEGGETLEDFLEGFPSVTREQSIAVLEMIKKPLNSDEIFAVCLETDDRELLVPFKIYRIKLRGEYIRVIDEKGEVAVYPKGFFLLLRRIHHP